MQLRAQGSGLRAQGVADVAASFQEVALKVIVGNTLKAMDKHNLKTLVIGGGVSANSRFREMLAREAMFRDLKIYLPPVELCSDNASMVAGLAYKLNTTA